MNSSDPPRPPSEATAARKKLPPSSREHFTSALVTSHGTPLPPDIAAYAIGAAFPPELVRPIAEALCTPERIEKTFHNYDAALLFELIEMDVNQTLLHIFDSVKKQRLTLWVLCVIPGPRNKMPSDRMEAERWKLFRRFLSQNGVSQDVIKRLRKCIAPWPKGAAYPVWVPDLLFYKLRMQAKEKQVAETDENASEASSAVHEQPGALRDARALTQHRSLSCS